MDDASLRQRGSLTFWLNQEVIEQWLNQEKTGRKGASNTYSNVAIELMATLQSLFGSRGRQTLMFCGIYIGLDGGRLTSARPQYLISSPEQIKHRDTSITINRGHTPGSRLVIG